MRKNKLREMWARGECALNGWAMIPSGFSAELLAHQGFHSVTIDMQHGIVDYRDAVSMLQGISTSEAVPIVRVPWNDPASIMKVLDAGAYGVICPLVNDAVEAKRLVSACRYPPAGLRSWGPSRAVLYGGADYGAHANSEIVVLPMIETKTGLDNVDEILSVEGVDGVYVGPSDLGLALGGKAMQDQTDPNVVRAIESIIAACRRRNKIGCIHTASAAYAAQMAKIGYQLVTLATDTRYLAIQAAGEIGAFKSITSSNVSAGRAGSAAS